MNVKDFWSLQLANSIVYTKMVVQLKEIPANECLISKDSMAASLGRTKKAL